MTQDKYCPERVERISAALVAGNSRLAAAAAGGITASTLARWRREHPEFEEVVMLSEAEAERTAVQYIREAMVSNWTAAAWWLERKHPEEWRKRESQDLTATIQAVQIIEAVRPALAEIGSDHDTLLIADASLADKVAPG